MTIKEMIKKLRDFENHYVSILNDKYIDDELINEVVKRLEELEELKNRLKEIKMKDYVGQSLIDDVVRLLKS